MGLLRAVPLWLVLAAVCCHAPVHYYASPRGSAAAAGTRDDPLGTIAACVARLHAPGDECRLQSGTYREPTVVVTGARGSASAPVVIAGAEGAEVLIDGTAELPNGTWTSGAGGLWEMSLAAAPLGGGVTQLWLDGEMLTPARWPNALWTEVQSFGMRAPFNWQNWARFDSSVPWSPSNYTSGVPLRFVDAGGPGGLGATGVSAKDAVFIGNIAHDDTFVGTVVSHTAGSNEFLVVIEPSVKRMGNTKVRKTHLLRHFILKMIILPRQARGNIRKAPPLQQQSLPQHFST